MLMLLMVCRVERISILHQGARVVKGGQGSYVLVGRVVKGWGKVGNYLFMGDMRGFLMRMSMGARSTDS